MLFKLAQWAVIALATWPSRIQGHVQPRLPARWWPRISPPPLSAVASRGYPCRCRMTWRTIASILKRSTTTVLLTSLHRQARHLTRRTKLMKRGKVTYLARCTKCMLLVWSFLMFCRLTFDILLSQSALGCTLFHLHSEAWWWWLLRLALQQRIVEGHL